jgi:hypothetical protein
MNPTPSFLSKTPMRPLPCRMLVGFLLLAMSVWTCAQPSCPPLFGDRPGISTSRTPLARAQEFWTEIDRRRIHVSDASEVGIGIVLPETEPGFRHSFGASQPASAANMGRVASIASQARSLGIEVWSREADGAARALALLADASKRVVVIVAHNENGSLRFPDGTELRIESAYENMRNPDRFIYVLSCNVRQAVPHAIGASSRRLSLDEAFGVAKSIKNLSEAAIASSRAVGYSELVGKRDLIDRQVVHVETPEGLKLTVRIAASAAGRSTWLEIGVDCSTDVVCANEIPSKR